MAFLDYFRAKKANTANIAKERLQVIVAHQRSERRGSKLDSPDYLKKLQLEIMDVIRKYIEIDQDQVKVELSQNDDCSVIELNLTLPENQ
jgi:cell division topological specificity factor